MADNSYARRVRGTSTIPTVGNPDLHKAREVAKARNLALSKFEKVLLIFCTFVLLVLMVVVVSGKINLSNAQHKLDTTQEKVTTVSNQNNLLKQEVNQLSSQSRLNKIGQNGGLTLKSKNIRNVNR
ncbi:cell division protein FtsL [Pediococcus argentinicus]|uniref:cell division protein FtsL n=1 Tax=Pediococcus argentinicus TaxID=480391 RepID=UPI00338FA552